MHDEAVNLDEFKRFLKMRTELRIQYDKVRWSAWCVQSVGWALGVADSSDALGVELTIAGENVYLSNPDKANEKRNPQ